MRILSALIVVLLPIAIIFFSEESILLQKWQRSSILENQFLMPSDSESIILFGLLMILSKSIEKPVITLTPKSSAVLL
jgi:hypothetical protein